MKKCPYCAEEIQDDAILCRYCRSNIEEVISAQEGKKCPNCAELILVDAKLCRYCGSNLDLDQSIHHKIDILPPKEKAESVNGDESEPEPAKVLNGMTANRKSYSVLFLAEIIALLPALGYFALKVSRFYDCRGNCFIALGDVLSTFSLVEATNLDYLSGLSKYLVTDLQTVLFPLFFAYGWVIWTIQISFLIIIIRVIRKRRIRIFYAYNDWLVFGGSVIGIGVRVAVFIIALFFIVRYAMMISMINSILPSL